MKSAAERWNEVGRSTSSVNLEMLSYDIEHLYKVLGFPMPMIIRLPSPMACHLAERIASNDSFSQVLSDDENLRRVLASTKSVMRSFGDFPKIVPFTDSQLQNAYLDVRGSKVVESFVHAQFLHELSFTHHIVNRVARMFGATPFWTTQFKSRLFLSSLDFIYCMQLETWLKDKRHNHHGAILDTVYPMMSIAENVGYILASRNVVFVSDKPKTVVIEERENRLSNDVRNPCLVYHDDWSVRLFQRFPILPHVARMKPTREQILSEPSLVTMAALVSLMPTPEFAEMFRHQRYAIETSQYGTLYEYTIEGRSRIGDRVNVGIVEVINGTKEPDGSFRHYFLRVPPGMRTALDAVAWTYGLRGDEYAAALRMRT